MNHFIRSTMVRMAAAAIIIGCFSSNSMAQPGIWDSYILLGSGPTSYFVAGSHSNSSGSAAFVGTNLGTFNAGSTYNLAGANLYSYTNYDNVCGGVLEYNVFRSGGSAGSFTGVTLSYNSSYGNQGSGSVNQEWSNTGNTANLLSGLSPGVYNLQVYYTISGNNSSSGCGNTYYESNSGSNYTATFTVVPVITSVTSSNSAANTGYTGSVLSISGIGFTGVTGASGVVIGGVNATSYTVVSNTLITATVPAGASTGSVVITNNSQTASAAFTALGTLTTISSFSPSSGAAGTSVTITGTGFNTTANQNVVFFGATMGTVTAASATSLTVTVPTGANYEFISVTNLGTNLTAYSAKPFGLTLAGNIDFASQVTFAAGSLPTIVAIGDMNGDGKADLAVANAFSNTLSVYRNTSSGSAVTFATQVTYATQTFPVAIAIGDLDGDGKTDLVVTNDGSPGTVSVYHNNSSGTISFGAQSTFATGAYPYAVSIGDIDGDGRPDLVVANSGATNVSVLHNTSSSGSISFATQVTFATGSPNAVAIGDIDGDGAPDVVVSNSGSTISVLHNSYTTIGTPAFASQVTYATGSSPFSVAIGDIDGDGKPDLAVANSGSSNVSVFHNGYTVTGTPGFAAQVTYAAGANPHAVAIGDINGDGKPDLAVANDGSGTISILQNNYSSTGTPSFASQVTYAIGSTPQSVVIGDLNGDGLPDLAAPTYSSSNYLSVLLQTSPQGSLTANGPFTSSGTGQLTWTATAGTGPFTVVYNDGTANRTQTGVVSGTAFNTYTDPVTTSTTYTLVSVTDVNGGVRTSGFTVGSATITITAPPTITSFSPASGAIGSSVTITGTNFNATAAQNIVFFGATMATVTSATASQLVVTVPTGATYQNISVTNLGTGLTAYSATPFDATLSGNIDFAPQVTLASGLDPYSVAIGDIDGDGNADIVVANTGASSISVYHNTSAAGAASFSAQVTYAAGSSPRSVNIADIDGDGKPDIAVVNNGGTTISVFHNNYTTAGTPSFAAQVTFAVGSSPVSMGFGDIDGDGKPDLAVANGSSSTVSVLHNNYSTVGTPAFAAQLTYATQNEPYAVAIGDIDGDGKPDLAVANFNANSISVFHNNYSTAGTPSFAAQVTYIAGTSPNSISIGDIDGDGKPDLAVGSGGSSSISVFHNNYSAVGTPSFAAQVTFAVGSHNYSLAIGDIDGDGKPDISVPNFNTSTVSVLHNNYTTAGTPGFASQLTFTASSGPFAVAIGDIDGDGKPDLVTANSSNSSVSVLLQSTPPQGSLSANGPFCTSGAGQLTWTATGGVGPYTIVYNDGTANRTQSGVVSGTAFNVYTEPVTSTTTYTLVSVTDAGGNVTTSGFTAGSVAITVNSVASISAQSTIGSSGVTFSYAPTGTVPPGTTYAWAVPSGTGFTGGASGAGQAPLTGNLTNTTSGSVTAVYTLTPTSSGCVGAAFTVSVVFIAPPTISSVAGTSPLVSGQAANTGYNGQTITITGTNLGSASSVTVGGTGVTIAGNTATTITFVLPTGASGTVSVTTGSGNATQTGFTNIGYITSATGDWATGSTWLNGSVPPPDAPTTINSNVGISTSVATAPTGITINSGASLTFNTSSAAITATTVTNNGTLAWTAAGTLTIAGNGTLTNNATYTGGTGTVYFSGAGSVGGSAAITFNNLTINGTLTLNTVPTINGNFQINGGNLTASPYYGSSSTLTYNVSSYGPYVEWVSNATSGAGVPNNVIIGNGVNTAVNFGSTGNYYQMNGSLTIANGSSLTQSNNSLSAGLKFGGSFTNNGTYNDNGRGTWFVGTSTGTLTSSSALSLSYLLLSSTANLELGSSNITLAGNTNALQFLSTGGLDLGGNTLTVSNNATILLNASGTKTIQSTGGAGTLALAGAATITPTGGSLATGANVTVTIAGGLTIGGASALTVNGTLKILAGGYLISNGPVYGTNSLLQYYTAANPYVRGLEWSAASGPGYPYHVQVSNNTTIDAGGTTATATPFNTAGNLTIDAGSSIYMDYSLHNLTVPLNIGGSLNLNGNMSESGTAGGDINISGNFVNNGTAVNFFPNGRAVGFIGSSAQTIGGTNTTAAYAFAYLTINNTGGGVSLGQPVTVANALTMTSGILTTTTTNTLTILNGAGTSGGSTSSYVKGPLNWQMAASLSGAGPYAFPVGNTGYLPFTLSNVSTGATGPVVQVQAYNSGSGGSADGTTVTAISGTEYWSASVVSGNFTSGSVSAARQTSLGSFNVIATSSSPTGSYSSLRGTVSGDGVSSSNAAGSSLGDFVFATQYPLPQGSLSANGPFCTSGAGSLTWTATSGVGPYTIVYNDGTANRTANSVVSGTSFFVATNPVTATTTYTLVSVTDNANSNVRTSGFTTGAATITINPVPSATPGSTTSASVCASAASYTVPSGYASANGNILWTAMSTATAGTLSGATTLTPTYTFSSSEVSSGATVTLLMTVSNGLCNAATTGFTLTIDAIPTAAAGTTTSGEVCAIGGSYTVPSGYAAANGTITWTAASTATAGTLTGASTLTPTYNFSGSEETSGAIVTLTMTVSNGVCASAATTFALTIDATPTASQGPTTAASVCASAGSYTVPSGYYSANGTVLWTASSSSGHTGTLTNTGTYTPTYTLSSADSGGATVTLSMNVSHGACSAAHTSFTLIINQTPTVTLGAIPPLCYSASPQVGVLTYTATTGSPNLCSINGWSSGGFASLNNFPLQPSPIDIPIPAGEAAGVYSANFSVTNSTTGCTSQLYSISTTINSPSASTTYDTICSGALPFSWNGLTFTGSGSQTASLTNSVGCDSAATLVLTVDTVTAAITGTDTACGPVSLTASGGTTYLWSGGSSLHTAANTFTSSNTYTVTVTTHGCTATASVPVASYTIPSPGITGTPSGCGSVSLTATGGTSFAWSGGSTPSAAANTFIANNTYTVTVSNANCSATTAELVTIYTVPSPGITGSTVGCGSASLTATGGTSYAWSGGSTPHAALNTFTDSNTYSVTVSNANCSAVTSAFVIVNPVATISAQSTSVGSGIPFTYTPTGGTIPSGTTYAWGAPSGSGFAGGASGSGQAALTGTLTNISAGAATATYSVTPTSGTCAGSAFTVSVAISSGANTWTGAISTTWGTAGNWTLSTPGSGTDAIIPSGLSRYPVVTSAASVNNLTLQSGASVTVSSGQTLSIYGTLTNNGTASFGPGTVQLSGSDSLFGSTAFGNLTIAGNAMVGPNAGDKISVSGILYKSSGMLLTSDKLTLISTAAQTALIEEGSGNLTGSAYVERFYGGYNGYSEISSPVSGATIANMTGVTIQGTNGSQSSLAGKEGTVEDYCEPCNTTTSLNNGYYNYTSYANALTSGLGLSAFTSYSATLSFFGTPATGSVTYNITKNGPNATTAGWNLIGNPYPSPISWTALKNANSGVMNATCYIWSPTSSTAGAWVAYNGGAGVGSATDVIALGQGFMILKSNAGTTALSFTNAQRYYSLNPPFYKTNLMPDEIRLTLTGGDNTAEILSYTQEGTTTGYDADADGPMPPFNMGADASNISFVSEGQPYLIDVYDHISEDMQIPLAVHAAIAGTYTINAKALNVSTYPVYLLDKATNTYYDLASQSVTFTSQGNEDKNNYSVVFKKASAQNPGTGIALESLYPNPANNQVSLGVMSGVTTSATLTMTDVLGRVVMTDDWSLTVGYNTNQFDISRYADGAYTVTIASGDFKTSAKFVIGR